MVNFFPADLADFAIPSQRPSEYAVLSEYEDSGSSDGRSDGGVGDEEDRRWEWRFGLVLEEASGGKQEEKARMTVYVADQDAEFLLKLDAEE